MSASVATGEVLVERRGRVMVITINRPHARNAMNGSAGRALAAAVDELDASPDLSVGVLTGAGGTFCAGMDLKAYLTGDTPEIPGRGMGGITQRLPATPLIAAVEGWALAGGLELMLACDMVVAAAGARFGVPEVKRGLVAGGGAAVRLPRRLPHVVAMEMLLTGDPIDAARAFAVGLVNRVVPDGTALASALELAETIAVNGPLAVAASKAVAVQSAGWSDDEVWDRQSALLAPVFASADAVEGATAFAEKRAARWTGR